MLNIAMTADHELFLGENTADAEHVMVTPTSLLLELLGNHGIPLTLFTDVCSIERYNSLLPDDPFPGLVEEQLRDAVKERHDVQLHIHPHWCDSYVKDGKWIFDNRRWRLHDWGFDTNDPRGAQAIIRRGKQYLEALLQPVYPKYQCVGFRAGGWCIQPEQQLLKALLEEGLWIDSTVFNGGFNPDLTRGFDFRQAPDLDSWWVNPDQGLLVPTDPGPNRVFEVSIGSSGRTLLNLFPKLRYKLDRKVRKRNPVLIRGYSIDDLTKPMPSFGTNVLDRIKRPVELCFDNACAKAMLDIVCNYVRKDRRQNGDSFICVIGHPKTLQIDDLSELDRFFRVVMRKFGKAVRFVTISDIADKQAFNRSL